MPLPEEPCDAAAGSRQCGSWKLEAEGRTVPNVLVLRLDSVCIARLSPKSDTCIHQRASVGISMLHIADVPHHASAASAAAVTARECCSNSSRISQDTGTHAQQMTCGLLLLQPVSACTASRSVRRQSLHIASQLLCLRAELLSK